MWAAELETYLKPYQERLDAYLDRRVVGNLIATVVGIVQARTVFALPRQNLPHRSSQFSSILFDRAARSQARSWSLTTQEVTDRRTTVMRHAETKLSP